jgi:hypothetical protein
MEAGRKLIECLIVYCKINVAETIKNIRSRKKKDNGEDEEEEGDDKDYEMFNARDLEKEL